MNFVSGLITHAWLLLSLRHDGRGLPSKHGPAIYMLAAIMIVIGLVFTMAYYHANRNLDDALINGLGTIASSFFIQMTPARYAAASYIAISAVQILVAFGLLFGLDLLIPGIVWAVVSVLAMTIKLPEEI